MGFIFRAAVEKAAIEATIFRVSDGEQALEFLRRGSPRPDLLFPGSEHAESGWLGSAPRNEGRREPSNHSCCCSQHFFARHRQRPSQDSGGTALSNEALDVRWPSRCGGINVPRSDGLELTTETTSPRRVAKRGNIFANGEGDPQ